MRLFFSTLPTVGEISCVQLFPGSGRSGRDCVCAQMYACKYVPVLQRETLLKQLEVNAQDMLSTTEELAIHEESEEQNYDV